MEQLPSPKGCAGQVEENISVPLICVELEMRSMKLALLLAGIVFFRALAKRSPLGKQAGPTASWTAAAFSLEQRRRTQGCLR
jgi:hypothetical protein